MSYSEKKASQKAGTYHGNSPLFNNIPEFQHLKPLHMYSHLKEGNMRVPDPNRRRVIKDDIEMPFEID